MVDGLSIYLTFLFYFRCPILVSNLLFKYLFVSFFSFILCIIIFSGKNVLNQKREANTHTHTYIISKDLHIHRPITSTCNICILVDVPVVLFYFFGIFFIFPFLLSMSFNMLLQHDDTTQCMIRGHLAKVK